MAEYNHYQSSANILWVIPHNLGVTSTVNDVFIDDNGSLKKVLPSSVVHSDDNTLNVTFSNAETGYARIIG